MYVKDSLLKAGLVLMKEVGMVNIQNIKQIGIMRNNIRYEMYIPGWRISW